MGVIKLRGKDSGQGTDCRVYFCTLKFEHVNQRLAREGFLDRLRGQANSRFRSLNPVYLGCS